MVGSLDVVARIGGDEFVVLSSRDRESALRLGETIVSAVSQHKYRIAKDSIRFGVSIGIDVCAHGTTDLRTLMSRADKRSEERRVGKEWGRTFRSRWSRYH